MSRLRNFNPYIYFKQKNSKNGVWLVFVILSVGMSVFRGLFSLKGWIQTPQFTDNKITTSWFLDAVQNAPEQLAYFWSFFIIDYFWSFLCLFLLSSYIYSKATLHHKKARWFYWVFLIIACITYILDCTENTLYLSTKRYPETIAKWKVACYSLAFLYTIIVAMYFSLKPRLAIIRDFILSSWISLLFLVIIGFTLPKAPQMNSIIVDLYYHPWMFVILLLGIYTSLYSVMLSHYPTYFLHSRFNKRMGKKKWRITSALGFFGIIWHSSDSKKEKITKTDNFKHESALGFLRKTLGVFFYMALFYMIAYTTDTNFKNDFSISSFSIFILLFFLWWLYRLNEKKNEWYTYWKGTIKPINYDDPKDKNAPSLHVEIITYLVSLVITILLHVVLLIILISFPKVYSYEAVVLSLVCIGFKTFTYMYYRTFRSVFKYAFFNEKIDAIICSFIITRDTSDSRTKAEKESDIKATFKANEDAGKSPIFRFIAKRFFVGILSNNVFFLKIKAYLGFANILFLIVINIWSSWALKINTILILLSYFYFFYGAIVIMLKHFIFYKFEADTAVEKEKKLLKEEKTTDDFQRKAALKKEIPEASKNVKKKERKHRQFLFAIHIAVLFLIVFHYLARFNEDSRSKLFELAELETTQSDSVVNFKSYISNLPEKRYYIGCYGGGMKANAWTMTVLSELDKNDSLYDKTVCISGASGGAIGLINYSVIKHEIEDRTIQHKAIRNIGTENILSMDITHLFGRDLINHAFVPKLDTRGKDRSSKAMRIYAEYSMPKYYTDPANFEFDEQRFKSLSFRKYWYEMYTKRKQGFPILISNTTDIKGRQGMAVSVKIDNPIIRDIVYTGASDILDINGKTLSFYNAASTTNRFPLISPAATIKGKGQYNDGGIYENSGLLSAFKLYEAIDEVDKTAKTKKSVFINIVNDKTAYIKSQLDSIMMYCKGKKLNTSNEISAIFNSVAATEMFPGYIKDKLKLLDTLQKDKLTFESIYLPHRFDFDDVRAIYTQDLKELKCVDDIYKIIENNNEEIEYILSKCEDDTDAIIEPEMSRVMAIPAFKFMQLMLKHSSIKQKIEKLQ
ncbi:hypothetical protein [Kordia jejudonensis]|uniref:hypothetical protein n=1 Tax=Kordia jejudonensis TaxID=1348245 RepID=UPI000629639C|nr:hypothetical protein [Kordia jejudonensis]